MRRPSPDLTTAFATRKATTTRSTLALAKPAKALPGSRVRVRTAADTASSEAVKSGKAFKMTAKIAAAKMAKRCHASLVSPAGIGENQIANARAKGKIFFRRLGRLGLAAFIFCVPHQARRPPSRTAPGPLGRQLAR